MAVQPPPVRAEMYVMVLSQGAASKVKVILYSDNVQYTAYFIYYECDKAAGSMALSMTLLMH